LAPELLNGRIQQFCKSCDIYALGISIFEILTDKASAWEHFQLPDALLRERIQSGMRPNTETLKELYSDDRLNNVISVVHQCWNENISKRPYASEVC